MQFLGFTLDKSKVLHSCTVVISYDESPMYVESNLFHGCPRVMSYLIFSSDWLT